MLLTSSQQRAVPWPQLVELLDALTLACETRSKKGKTTEAQTNMSINPLKVRLSAALFKQVLQEVYHMNVYILL